ncbi:MAG: fibronectin type III domain-containing protein [Lachnospiraceae bacterium]|nr:fibronectin type III domain-containing protein [Lachnospiraceae bacterium]
MRKKLLIKSAACVCAGVLAVSSISATNVFQTFAYEDASESDLTVGALITTIDSGEGEGYTWLGYIGCDADSTYKYLKFTYSGDATATEEMRWEMKNSFDETIGVYWFAENAEGTLKTVEDTLIPAPTEEEQTVIIDLAASGIDTSDGIQAFHIHGTKGKGKLVISDAAFLKELPSEGETTGEITTAETTTVEDIILDGDETGASSMVGEYKAPTVKGVPDDKYKYLGFATLKDVTSDYKYLIMTFDGNITQLRFQFANVVDGSETAITEPYWFNPEGQTYFFVTPDESAIPLEGTKQTVVIDLEKSGIDLGQYNSIHMHCDLMATYGDFSIVNARLSSAPEVKESDKETPVKPEVPTEITTEVTTTVTPTTVAPTTVAPTTKAVETTKKAVKPEKSKVKTAKRLKGGKKIKLTFKKVKGADSYQYQCSTSKKFKKAKTVTVKSVSTTVKKLKAKKVYYVRVRAVKAGVVGDWSKAKKIKVKK